ncbi:MAG TPA: 1,4-alpha-glucan branching enzyme, partial [Methylococcaceae bacterium]|nr:1,4-alpha-glucan branching enzyme [Methylococcaceae bacterium]
LFEARIPIGNAVPVHYPIHWTDKTGQAHAHVDPYSFEPFLTDFDLYLFGEGRHHHVYQILGAHPMTRNGIAGTAFAVWAPNAERVSVVGDFNGWDGRVHAMRSRGASGVYELFIPGL